jgi:glycosyltransferase involved in cell wall biosynthesis
VPEIVEHGRTGLIVSPQNKRDLADAVRTLADDPKRRRDMGAAGRARSLCFSVKTMVAAYADLFAHLLCGSRAADAALAPGRSASCSLEAQD